jgi:hypothetical protein
LNYLSTTHVRVMGAAVTPIKRNVNAFGVVVRALWAVPTNRLRVVTVNRRVRVPPTPVGHAMARVTVVQLTGFRATGQRATAIRPEVNVM